MNVPVQLLLLLVLGSLFYCAGFITRSQSLMPSPLKLKAVVKQDGSEGGDSTTELDGEQIECKTCLTAQEKFALNMGKELRVSGAAASAGAEAGAGGGLRAAAASALAAVGLFCYQRAHPPEPLQLLRAMARESPPLAVCLANGKPTVVDFYADWCSNCKAMAPTMRALEKEYAGRVNFLAVDGADPRNADLVGRFRVDGIPHLALITADHEVETALIGMVPKPILEEEMDALLAAKPLPWVGYDAFRGKSHSMDDIL